MKSQGNYERIREELEESRGLKIIAANRPGKRRGGGVCIVYDP